MNNYPQHPQSIVYLAGESFRFYVPLLKVIFPLILLMVLVKDLYLYLGGLPENHWVQLILIFVMILLEIYLSSVALVNANSILSGSPLRLNEACKTIYRRLVTIYLGFFSIILLLCAIFFIGHFLSNLIVYLVANKETTRNLTVVFLIGLPLTICLVLFFFIMPLLALGSGSVQRSFRDSIALVGFKHWLKTFIVYAICVIFLVIISPGTKHGQWLIGHHLNFVFDIVIFSLILPLIFNFILLLLNDLRLRQRS